MNESTEHDPTARISAAPSSSAFREAACDVLRDRRIHTVRFAPMFPSPRTERVRPGNLVVMTAASDGTESVLWRWYDAVVLDDEAEAIRLWEPAHGEVLARARRAYLYRSQAPVCTCPPGSLAPTGGSAPTTAEARDADVELGEVESCSPRTDCGTPSSESALRVPIVPGALRVSIGNARRKRIGHWDG